MKEDKKMKKIVIAGLSCILALASCTKNVTEGGEGALKLSFRVSEPATKAALSSEELLNTAVVKIYKADFSGKVREYRYSAMPSSIYLPADDYRVDVLAGEAAKESPALASWEQKSYSGSSDFKIVAGATSSTEVLAKVSNVVSRISFDDSIAEMFEPGYSCSVAIEGSESASSLVYTAAESGKDGYFIVSGFEPSLMWTFSGTLKKDGSVFTKNGTVPAVEGGKRYSRSFKFTEKDGILDLDILVDDGTNYVYDDIIFVPVTTGVASSSKYEVWAGHFTAHADVDETSYDVSKVFFEYSVQGADSWTRVAATRDSEGVFSAVFKGLVPSTSYDYRLVVTPVGGTSPEEVIPASNGFTTESAPSVPNGGFETTSNAESSKYKSFYDPASADEALRTKWWGDGNPGSTMVGSNSVICYPDASDYKEGTQSVCLQSRYVVVKFAAGNLFSGRFGSTIGTTGGTVYFGRPFTGRPTALRVWAKYSGGIINRAESNAPAEGQKGNYDRASLRAVLGTWDYKTYGGDADSPVLVNTTEPEKFIDFNTDPATVAFGEKILASDADGTTNEWVQYTIPIVYKDTNKYPTHIILSFAASMYGDYFAGYDDSKLWLDGLELLYE